MNKKVLWESIKEPLRLAIMLIIGEAVVYVSGLPQPYAPVIALVLRGIDKFLHELGKVKDNDTLKRGLTQF